MYFMIKQQQTLSKSFAYFHLVTKLPNTLASFSSNSVLSPRRVPIFRVPKKKEHNYTPFIHHMQEQNEQGGY